MVMRENPDGCPSSPERFARGCAHIRYIDRLDLRISFCLRRSGMVRDNVMAGGAPANPATSARWGPPLAQGPERAVPEDERVAGTQNGRLDLADADVVVTGRMDFQQAALQPGRAALDERDAVGPEPMRYLPPRWVDSGRATSKPLRDELLGAGQDAHVERPALDHR